jgi:hypothetical protein
MVSDKQLSKLVDELDSRFETWHPVDEEIGRLGEG